jgi:hypothetical protein
VIGGPPGFVYVRKGLSPRAILNFGSHKATKLPDIWLPQRHKPASEAMQAQIRKELCALNVSHRDGYEIYNVRTRQCTCWSFTYTGQLCKHAAAYNLSHLRSGSTCSAEEAACKGIRDIASALRDRERRVPKPLQVPAVLGDDMMVWTYLQGVIVKTINPDAGSMSDATLASEIVADAHGVQATALDQADDGGSTNDSGAASATALQPAAKRRVTGYQAFQKEKWAEEKRSGVSRSFVDVSTHISKQWRDLTAVQKQQYVEQAERMRPLPATKRATSTNTVGVDDVRSGPARPIAEKGRNVWKKLGADKQRPRFGLKARDVARSGTIRYFGACGAHAAVCIGRGRGMYRGGVICIRWGGGGYWAGPQYVSGGP